MSEIGLINRKALRLRGKRLSQTRGRKEGNKSTRPTESSQFPLNPRVPLWEALWLFSHIAMLWVGSSAGTSRGSQILKHLVITYLLSVCIMSGTLLSTGAMAV